MYVAGLSYKIIGVVLGIAIPLVIAAFVLITQTDIKIIDSYQKDRIMSWMYPEDETYKDDVIQQQKIQLQPSVSVNLPERDIITTKFLLQTREILLLRFRQTLSFCGCR